MGDDEIIPNGSIHWAISHEEAAGGGGRRRRQWNKGGEIRSDGNESIELVQGNQHLRGVDTIPANRRPELRVTLRFKTMEDLTMAIGAGLANARRDPQTGMIVMRFTKQANGPNEVSNAQANEAIPNKWAQVRVEW